MLPESHESDSIESFLEIARLYVTFLIWVPIFFFR